MTRTGAALLSNEEHVAGDDQLMVYAKTRPKQRSRHTPNEPYHHMLGLVLLHILDSHEYGDCEVCDRIRCHLIEAVKLAGLSGSQP